MGFHIVMALLAFFPGISGFCGKGEGLIQGSSRSWGQPASGLRASISVERTPVLKGRPFVVSVMVENISGTKVDLKVIAAFHLRNSSRTSPESTLTFGSYWCPVNLAEGDAAGKPGLILASPSRLVLEKGTSISASMDLARHGWDKSTSSWWPARDFAAAVAPGNYLLRLDVQVEGSSDPKWILSNEVKVVIKSGQAFTNFSEYHCNASRAS